MHMRCRRSGRDPGSEERGGLANLENGMWVGGRGIGLRFNRVEISAVSHCG